MTLQLPPPDTDGGAWLIRTSLPLLQEDPQDCPRGNALRARPLIEQAPERSRGKPIEDFSLAPVMNALDAIELDGVEAAEALRRIGRNRKYHPSHVRWTHKAVRNYLAARERAETDRVASGRPKTVAVREEWTSITNLRTPTAHGATRYERTAWGRRYASADGSERELWLLSVNVLKEDRPSAVIAEAASVVATGAPSRSAFREPHHPVPGNTVGPDRVRIVGVACGDGEHTVLADWDTCEVAQKFSRDAKPALGRVIADDRLNPGSSCTRCEALLGCEQPPRAHGLLGVPGPRRPRKRRSVSATDLRMHARCPALFHLTRVLHLRSAAPESPAIRRGRAVDDWLNQRHRQGRCRGVTLPDALPGLADEEQATALAMLAQHVRACPLDGLASGEEVLVQKRLTAYDPELDVLIIADPDLLYTRSGGWIWHETKTTTRPPWEGEELLQTYPQLALAVLLMSADVPGGDPRRSRIELELLLEDTSWREVIDPGESDTQAEARRTIAGMAGPWAVDETYEPKTGKHCGGCEMLGLCDAGQAHVKAG